MLTAIRRAFRTLGRTPGFAIVAVVTLALAIAAIGTTFSIVNSVLLQPLPYPGAERIIRIVRVQGTCDDCPISRPALFDWVEQSGDVFEAMSAFVGANGTLTGDGAAEKLTAYAVTADFWSVMGVAPVLGRPFDKAQDDSGENVVVISNGLWQRRYGGDLGIVGRKVVLNDEPYTIGAVMPAHFNYPPGDVWLPANLAQSGSPRDSHSLQPVARLREGVSLEAATQAMARITERQAKAFPAEHEGFGARLTPLQERVTGPVRPALNVLFVASAMVVLIACANLANLMLARSQSRRREIALRAALGASRIRLVTGLLAESALIAAAGAGIGLALSAAAIAVLPSLAPDLLPPYSPVRVDATVFAFVAMVALLALFGFGLLPAWRTARADPALALQDEARGGTTGRARSRARGVLVVAEVGLSLMLLAGAALLLESIRRLSHVDPTIDIDKLVTATISLPAEPELPGERPEDWVLRHERNAAPMIDRVLSRLSAMPEVESVAIADALPLSGRGNSNSSVTIVGREFPGGPQAIPLTEWRFVSSDYFRTMGLAVQRGRAYGPDDGRSLERPTEVLVNDTFVKTFLADVDPIGQQLNAFGDEPKTIVGVVESARQWGLAADPSPEVYFSAYDAFATDLSVVVRTRVPPGQFAETLGRTLREVLPNVPVTEVRTMDAVLDQGAKMRRFFAGLMMTFSGVAVLLAMVGLYGVIAYSVAQRRAELGVRMSLGADAKRVLALVLKQGMALVGLGLAFGIVGALALSRVLSSQLYGVAPHDPLVLSAVALVLLVTGAAACALPAWRASRIAPTEALRS